MKHDNDPEKLPVPTTMATAVMEKCHAVSMLRCIDAELVRIRKERKKWNKRLGLCLRQIAAIDDIKEFPFGQCGCGGKLKSNGECIDCSESWKECDR